MQTHIKVFRSAVFYFALGLLSLAQHNQRCRSSMHLWSSRGNAKGAISAQKALQGLETVRRELQYGTKENKNHPDEGSLICPQGKSMIFFNKNQTLRIQLSGQTWLLQGARFCWRRVSNSPEPVRHSLRPRLGFQIWTRIWLWLKPREVLSLGVPPCISQFPPSSPRWMNGAHHPNAKPWIRTSVDGSGFQTQDNGFLFLFLAYRILAFWQLRIARDRIALVGVEITDVTPLTFTVTIASWDALRLDICVPHLLGPFCTIHAVQICLLKYFDKNKFYIYRF